MLVKNIHSGEIGKVVNISHRGKFSYFEVELTIKNEIVCHVWLEEECEMVSQSIAYITGD